MQRATALLILLCTAGLLPAQEKSEEPTNEKAQKTYKQAQEYLHQYRKDAALDAFKKADKQDGRPLPRLSTQHGQVRHGTR